MHKHRSTIVGLCVREKGIHKLSIRLVIGIVGYRSDGAFCRLHKNGSVSMKISTSSTGRCNGSSNDVSDIRFRLLFEIY